MSNVLLIHPSKKVLGKDDSFYSNEYLTPSLGLGYLAASLNNNGLTAKILDLRLQHRTIDDVFLAIERDNPIFIGITAFTNEITSAGKIAKEIKKRYPNCFLIIGGPHPTALPEQTLSEFPHFDLLIIGEGEETIIDISRLLLENKMDLSVVNGIAYIKNNNIIINSERKKDIDIDLLPFPAWDAFELEHYKGPFMISSSRGCPFPCYFCTPNYLGKVRVRNPQSVANEMKSDFEKFGATRFQFADATLSLLEKNLHSLCDEIIRLDLNKKIEWDCETRADRIDEELIKKMKLAGCKWIALGVETGSERILSEVIKKGESKEEIRSAVNLIKKTGINVRCFFLLGHYTETIDTIQETINFALELNPDALSFGILVPNPGTKLRDLAERGEGGLKLLHSNWDEYSQVNFSCMESNLLNVADLKQWQSKAYFTFYSRHPIKAFNLFFNSSGYNYNLKGFVNIPIMLLKNLFLKK